MYNKELFYGSFLDVYMLGKYFQEYEQLKTKKVCDY